MLSVLHQVLDRDLLDDLVDIIGGYAHFQGIMIKEIKPPKIVQDLAVLANGRLISASYNGEISIWNLRSETSQSFRPVKRQILLDLHVCADGSVVALFDKEVRYWQYDPFRQTLTLSYSLGLDKQSYGKYNSVSSFRDGRVVIGGQDLPLIEWDPITNTIHVVLKRVQASKVIVLPNEMIAFGGDAGVYIVDPVTRRYILGDDRVGEVSAIAVSSSGTLAVGNRFARIHVWDPSYTNVQVLEYPNVLPLDSVQSLVFLNDGRLVSGYGNGRIRVWDVTTMTVDVLKERHFGAAVSLAVLPNGLVVSSSNGGEIRVWA